MLREALSVYEAADALKPDAIFEPLRFRSLEVKNRVFRSNVAGRLDDYDGGGTQTRINWEPKFARGGVGAILSSRTAVDERGKIVPAFAGIETDERVPFWREPASASTSTTAATSSSSPTRAGSARAS